MDYIETAKKALKDFAIKSQSIELIVENLTKVYKVIDDNGNDKYCLRLHKSNDNKKDDKVTVNSELEWISAIANDTDIAVPVPYKNIHGEYVTEIDGISCSLTKWLDGENKLDRETINLLIELMAKMHKHTSTWEIPKGFTRPQFNVGDLTTACGLLDNLRADKGSKDVIEILLEAAKKAIIVINSIEKNQTTWGLIHNDLQPQNLLFLNGTMSPIDFGSCGFGFYLSDICTAFHYIPPSYRETFFNEYVKHMPLPNNYVCMAEALYIAGHVIGLAPHTLNGDTSEWLTDYIINVANKEAIHFINNKPFLFETAFFM